MATWEWAVLGVIVAETIRPLLNLSIVYLERRLKRQKRERDGG